jgi:hypothetical protein
MGWEGNGKYGRVGGYVGKGEKKGIDGSRVKVWEIIKYILRYLLKNVGNSSEGKIILNPNFILKNLQCSIHKNSALL